MFQGLPQEERSAFFNLMDEYFASRPHLLPGNPPVASQPAPPGSVTVTREDMDRAGRFAATPMGQKVTGFAAGQLVGNKALGNAAASQWANYNKNASTSAPPPPGRKGPPPAAPSSASKPSSLASLTTGRSIGSLNLGARSSAINSAIGRKSSPAAAAPVAASRSPPPAAPSVSAVGTLPPPARRGTGIVSPPTAEAVSHETEPISEGIGMADALYDYGDGSDPDDLVIREGERIILLEKISDDWWRAKKSDGSQDVGIVPTSYVRQL